MHISVSIHGYMLFIALKDSRVGIGEKERSRRIRVCTCEINANLFRGDFSLGYTSLITISHPLMECGK